MNLEEIRTYCIAKNGVEEGFPFDSDTLVFKVGGKMFLLLDLNSNPPAFNIKCEPAIAIELREKYVCVKPGFHMNKTHWNTVTADGSVNYKLICSWIDNSYELIVKSLPKAQRNNLLGLKSI